MSVTAFARVAAVAVVVALMVSSGPALAIGSSDSDSGSDDGQQAGAYERGAAAAREGRYRDAIALLEEAVRENPGNADAHNYLGFSHRKLGEIEAARTHYRKALDIDPEHIDAMEYLGELYVQTGEHDAAEQMLRRIELECGRTCEQFEELSRSLAAAQGN